MMNHKSNFKTNFDDEMRQISFDIQKIVAQAKAMDGSSKIQNDENHFEFHATDFERKDGPLNVKADDSCKLYMNTIGDDEPISENEDEEENEIKI